MQNFADLYCRKTVEYSDLKPIEVQSDIVFRLFLRNILEG